jgi:hypothetical protein
VLKSIDSKLLERLRPARASAARVGLARRRAPEAARGRHRRDARHRSLGKEQGAGTWKGGFGFHPLLCFLDGADAGFAGILRPGNTASNTAKDHERVLVEALEQVSVHAFGEHIWSCRHRKRRRDARAALCDPSARAGSAAHASRAVHTGRDRSSPR